MTGNMANYCRGAKQPIFGTNTFDICIRRTKIIKEKLYVEPNRAVRSMSKPSIKCLSFAYITASQS